MGRWVGRVGGVPPYPLLDMIKLFEARLSLELDEGVPNIQKLLAFQEEIEDTAEDLGVHIEWFSVGNHMVAELYGDCVGSYHMTDVDQSKLSGASHG